MSNAPDNIREDVYFNRVVSFQTTLDYMLTKVRSIFRYEGLPLTIPHRHLERFLTQDGFAVIYQHEEMLFATNSKPSGGEDMYGDETFVQIDHRSSGKTERLTKVIGVDAAIIRNDPDRIGLEPLLTEYSALMAQGKITMLRNLVDLRGNYIIQAKDEAAYESALAYEEAVRRGDTSVILAEEFDQMEGLVVHSTPISNNPATQTIELIQYINSLYYSELGIKLVNNMKSQYVNETELERSTGSALVSIMLDSRKIGLRDVEALFGATISVAVSDEWNDEQEKDDAQSEGDYEAGGAGSGPADAPWSGGGADEASSEEEGAEEEGGSDGAADELEALDTDPEEVTGEELAEATGAMLGEEVSNDVPETANDQVADDGDPEDEADEDDAKRSDVDA